MIRFSIVAGFLKKEFLQMLRDVRMRMIVFAAPVIMLILFGYAAVTDVKSINMGFLDEDKSTLSREFLEKFTASGYFISYKAVSSASEADKLLDKGNIELFIHINHGFEKKIRTGKTAPVQILVDGTDSSRASVIISYINAITQDYSFNYFNQRIALSLLASGHSGARIPGNINLKERYFFNPDLSSRNYFLPVIQGLLIIVVSVMLTSMSIVKERETGTIEQIAVSPVHPWELILGKTIPFIVVSFIDVMVIMAVIVFWFRVPFKGNFVFLSISGIVFIISTTSVGLFISTISKTQQQAILTMFLFLMPSVMFSGFIFPVYAMPPAAQAIAFINPMKYFVEIIRGVFLKGTGFAVLWPDLAALVVIGAILLFLSAGSFGKSLE